MSLLITYNFRYQYTTIDRLGKDLRFIEKQ